MINHTDLDPSCHNCKGVMRLEWSRGPFDWIIPGRTIHVTDQIRVWSCAACSCRVLHAHDLDKIARTDEWGGDCD